MPPARDRFPRLLHLPPNPHPLLATVGKQRRLGIPEPIQEVIGWTPDPPKRLVVRALVKGSVRLLSPASTLRKEQEWTALETERSEGAAERLVSDRRKHFWVRFEKVGFRIYVTQEVGMLLALPETEDLDERVYVQAATDADVLVFSVDGYFSSLST